MSAEPAGQDSRVGWHDIPFWHLESVGSRRAPEHDAARLVNRWHLTAKWGELVRTELNGRSPIRFKK